MTGGEWLQAGCAVAALILALVYAIIAWVHDRGENGEGGATVDDVVGP